MIKKLNTVFFSICFLAAIIAETYCIQILKGDWISVVGIGVVVLITGYLLFDSIRTQIAKGSDKIQYLLDHMYREDSEKWSERYTEIINLQKASYSVAKKNHVFLKDQYEIMLQRLESLEESNAKALLKIAELQKKSLEGQKNALNLQINYNKENTKQLIKALQQEGSRQDQSELFNKIAILLEQNNELLKELQETPMVATPVNSRTFTYENQTDFEEEIPYQQELKITGFHNEDEYEDINMNHDKSYESEDDKEEEKLDLTWDMEEELKRLTDLENKDNEGSRDIEDNKKADDNQEYDQNAEFDPHMILNPEFITESEPEFIQEHESEPLTEVEQEMGSQESEQKTIVPFYDDPNKALSQDEIAALFASFGQ